MFDEPTDHAFGRGYRALGMAEGASIRMENYEGGGLAGFNKGEVTGWRIYHVEPKPAMNF